MEQKWCTENHTNSKYEYKATFEGNFKCIYKVTSKNCSLPLKLMNSDHYGTVCINLTIPLSKKINK